MTEAVFVYTYSAIHMILKNIEFMLRHLMHIVILRYLEDSDVTLVPKTTVPEL